MKKRERNRFKIQGHDFHKIFLLFYFHKFTTTLCDRYNFSYIIIENQKCFLSMHRNKFFDILCSLQYPTEIQSIITKNGNSLN